MNIYIKSIVYGLIATVLAYILNVIFKYVDNTVTTWALTLAAFIIGNYFGIKIRNRRKQPTKD
jgi:uncharacterized membrane protein YjjB (DUF3815 family)